MSVRDNLGSSCGHLLHAVAGLGGVLAVSGEVALHADPQLGPGLGHLVAPLTSLAVSLLARGVGRGQRLLLPIRGRGRGQAGAGGLGPEAGLTSPSPGLVFVVRMLPLVKLTQPLSLDHEGLFLLLFENPEEYSHTNIHVSIHCWYAFSSFDVLLFGFYLIVFDNHISKHFSSVFSTFPFQK